MAQLCQIPIAVGSTLPELQLVWLSPIEVWYEFQDENHKGIEKHGICKVVFEYLDGIAKRADQGEGKEKDADVGVGHSK
jgi:hypothetical protein